MLGTKDSKRKTKAGELSSVDGYMNIALEKTVEYVGGEVKNRYGDVFIRGNNGLSRPLEEAEAEAVVVEVGDADRG